MASSISRYLNGLVEQISFPHELSEEQKISLAAELFLNEETRTYSKHSLNIEGLSTGLANRDEAGFPLKRYFLGHDVVREFSIDSVLLEKFNLNRMKNRFCEATGVHFLVHPDTDLKETFQKQVLSKSLQRSDLTFIPGSSTRSVFVCDPEQATNLWIKLHLQDVKISRYFRNLGGRSIQLSVELSQEVLAHLEEISKKANTIFGYYADFYGSALRNPNPQSRDREWGYLLRSAVPITSATKEKQYLYLPLFSLYGKNKLDPESQLLLIQMIELSGMDPRTFVLNHVMLPIIRSWAAVFEKTGIIFEPHGQNTVLLIDPKTMLPEGVSFRDPDTAVSSRKRREIGLETPFYDRNVHDDTPSEEMPEGDRSEISRVIDISMGKNTFEYLANSNSFTLSNFLSQKTAKSKSLS